MSVTIGSDPEFFLRDQRSGTVVPIIGLLGGSKGKALPIPGLDQDGYGMQEDNVMAEYNIPAARNSDTFAFYITAGREAICDFVRTKQPDLVADVGQCTRLFSPEQLEHPQAATFGCSADYNAYDNGAVCRPIDPLSLEDGDGAWRFAGGHVHIGYEAEVPQFVAARMADLYLGLPSVALDTQGKRRELYGSAGRFRTTEYGIEYRTLSNFWIWDQDLAFQIGDRAMALGYLLEGEVARVQEVHAEVPWTDVQRAINTEDEELAADLIAYCTQDLDIAL